MVSSVLTLRTGIKSDNTEHPHDPRELECDFAMSRRFAAPQRGADSSPGHELLGVITSHGPSRESNRPSRKSSGAAKAINSPAACTVLPAQRVRSTFSSAESEPALLQRGMPEGGAKVVTMEGSAEIPGNEVRQRETDGPKPALSRAHQKPPTTRARGG
jgi:hypothetical protein